MSAEQGDVEAMILSALGLTSEELNEGERERLAAALEATKRDLLTAVQQNTVLSDALESAERERDEARANADGMARAPYGEFSKMRARAEKAERALAEAIDAVIWLTGLGDLSGNPEWERIRDERMPEWRAALRPSEEASDES